MYALHAELQILRFIVGLLMGILIAIWFMGGSNNGK